MTLYDSGKHIVSKLREAGHTAYFAGGFVRDYLMGCPSDDIDIASTASVEEVASLFEKTIPVGISFGIIIVVIDNTPFEVATFRTEDGYEDGRRPTSVSPTDPKTDALRRDFTINGMYFDPIDEKVIDYVNGTEDLERKVIRAIGDPKKRFQEDRLRMIRAARYAARFGFSIEETTKNEIKAHAHLLFPAVAIERVRNELDKMAKFGSLGRGLTLLSELNLLPVIFPVLDGIAHETIAERIAPLYTCPEGIPSVLQLLFLFPDLTLEEKLSLIKYLKGSKAESTQVEHDHKTHAAIFGEDVSPIKKVEVHAFPGFQIYLMRCMLSVKNPADVQMYLTKEQAFAKEHQDAIERKRCGKTLLTSEDLMQLGIQPGRKMGEILQKSEALAVLNTLQTKDSVIAALQKEGLVD